MSAELESRVAVLECQLFRALARIEELSTEVSSLRAAAPSGLAGLPREAVIDIGELAALQGVHRKTVTREIARGTLPKPVRWGKRRVWTAGALVDWIKAREARSRAEDDAIECRLARELVLR